MRHIETVNVGERGTVAPVEDKGTTVKPQKTKPKNKKSPIKKAKK